jgi:hypothetical protein
MNEPTTRHGADDPYWVEASVRRRRITLDLDAIEGTLFGGDSPAYRLMEAMIPVKEHEGMDNYRGAPRLVLALLERLDVISKAGARNAG